MNKRKFICFNAAFVRNMWKDWKLLGRYNYFKNWYIRTIDIASDDI